MYYPIIKDSNSFSDFNLSSTYTNIPYICEEVLSTNINEEKILSTIFKFKVGSSWK
jgi:hypothetical protein